MLAIRRVNLLSVLRALHRWIGLALCVVLAAVAISGGLLLARGPYERARFPAIAQPPAVEMSIAQQAVTLAAIESRFGAAGLRTIKFPRPGTNAYRLYFANDDEAFVASDTGALLGRWSWRSSLPAFLFELHAHLFGEAIASTINGIAALSGVFLALTGLLLWWPRRATAYRLRRALPRGVSSGELLRSHAAAGAIASLPILLFTATGAGLIFYPTVSAVLSRCLDAQPPSQPSARIARRPGVPEIPWIEQLSRVHETFPDGDLVMFNPGRGDNAVRTFRLRLPGEWHPNGRSYLLLDPYTGRIVQRIDAREQGPGTRFAHAIYPLHAATLGGGAYLLFALLAATGLAWNAIGGAAAYLQKLRTWSARVPERARRG